MMWFFIAFALLLALAGFLLFRLRRRTPPPTLSDLETLFDKEIDRYAHLGRLFAPEDFEFLERSRRGAALVPELRRLRLRAVRRYIQMMRAEFYSLVAIASLFAASPTARGQNFAARLARQRFQFEVRMLRFDLRWLAGHIAGSRLDLAPLSEAIHTLRAQADGILRVLTPEDLSVLRTTLQQG